MRKLDVSFYLFDIFQNQVNNISKVFLSIIEVPQRYTQAINQAIRDFQLSFKSMQFRTLLILSLALTVLSAYDQSYVIYMNSVTGPFNSTVPTYGNYALNDSYYVAWTSDKERTQSYINNMMDYYNRSQFPRGPEYSLEYYRDSTLSTILYVFYKKLNLTRTERYYMLRVQYGPKNGTFYYLGQDKCQVCRPGRQMPYLNYDMLDPNVNNSLTIGLLNVLNNMQKTNFIASNIQQIKHWKFPNGSLYIPIITHANYSQLYTAIVDTPGNYMTFLNQLTIPQIIGNAPIDYVYIRHYINCIFAPENPLQGYPYFTGFRVVMLEYYLDPLFKDAITFMINLQITNTPNILKVMGLIYKILGTSTLESNPYSTVFRYKMAYASSAVTPYYNSSYFNNDNFDERMGNNATTDVEYKALIKSYSNANLLSLSYIDYPNGFRQYSLQYFLIPDKRTYNVYQLREGGSSPAHQIIPNCTFNDHSDWKGLADKVYEYVHEYELISLDQAFPSAIGYYNNIQYCSLDQNQFELMIFLSPIKSSKYCMNRMVFLKDMQTNRIIYIGNATAPSSQCTFVLNINPFPKQYCPSVTASTVDVVTAQKMYNALSNKFINTNGEAFTLSELSYSTSINTTLSGVPNVYYINFVKNGITSVYYVTMSASGAYTIVDYVEAVEGDVNNGGSTPLPVIGAAAPTSSSGQSSTSNSSNSSNSNINSQANTSSSNIINNNINSSSKANNSNSTNNEASNLVNANTSNNIGNSNNNPANNSSINANKTNTAPITDNNSSGSSHLITESNSNLTSIGKGELPLAYIESLYPKIQSTIKSYNPSANIQNKPTIYYYVDNLMKFITFSIAYSYQSSLYQVYEIALIIDNNQYLYIGKLYLPSLPQTYWQATPINLQGDLLTQVTNVINKNAACANVPIKKAEVTDVSLLSGDYYIIDAVLANGYTVTAGLLRNRINWQTIFSFFEAPPTPNPPSPPPSSSPAMSSNHSNLVSDKTSSSSTSTSNTGSSGGGGMLVLGQTSTPPQNFTSMTASQVQSDISLQSGFNLIYLAIQSKILGCSLAKIQKGFHSNGTIQYHLYYFNTSSNVLITIIFLYDPVTQSVLALTGKTSTQSDQTSTSSSASSTSSAATSSSSSSSTSSSSSQRTDTLITFGNFSISSSSLQQKLVDYSLKAHPQLASYTSIQIQLTQQHNLLTGSLNYVLANKSSYYQTIQITLPSLSIREIRYARLNA